MTIRVGILGATGYTALELMRILLRHPGAQITVVTSRQDRSSISATHPSLAGLLNLNLEDPDPECALLNHVRNEPQPATIDVTVSNSFGFGGNNTCLVLKKAA